MSIRAERRQRAEAKRRGYQEQIILRMKETLETTKSIRDSFLAGDRYAQELIEKNPQEAHLVRSAAYRLKGDLEEIISRVESGGINP